MKQHAWDDSDEYVSDNLIRLPETQTVDQLDGIDESFVIDFREYDDPDDEQQRWTTWYDVEPLSRGPEPRPDWVVTSRGAIDTELGILKTGKEADVFLLERAVPDDPTQSVVMAAKRYRGEEHRSFHRSSTYTEGRRTRNSRDTRALAKKTAHGDWRASTMRPSSRGWRANANPPRRRLAPRRRSRRG